MSSKGRKNTVRRRAEEVHHCLEIALHIEAEWKGQYAQNTLLLEWHLSEMSLRTETNNQRKSDYSAGVLAAHACNTCLIFVTGGLAAIPLVGVGLAVSSTWRALKEQKYIDKVGDSKRACLRILKEEDAKGEEFLQAVRRADEAFKQFCDAAKRLDRQEWSKLKRFLKITFPLLTYFTEEAFKPENLGNAVSYCFATFPETTNDAILMATDVVGADTVVHHLVQAPESFYHIPLFGIATALWKVCRMGQETSQATKDVADFRHELLNRRTERFNALSSLFDKRRRDALQSPTLWGLVQLVLFLVLFGAYAPIAVVVAIGLCLARGLGLIS
jgi:hypothetical protein